MQATTHQLKIGPYDIKPVPTGLFGLDGGAMFGTVPRVLWEKTNPPDEKNRISLEARALLLVSQNHKVLVDVGNGSDFIEKYGEKLGGKFAELYAISDGASGISLLNSLEHWGLHAEDITDVILTHLHFDHAGGATCVRDGRVVPTFPNAHYYVQRANLETAQAPNIREKASYLPANFQPLLDAGVLTLLDGDVENLIPGISVFVVNGHTRAQQLVKVSDGTKTLVYCGDLIATSSHIRLPFVMGYDLNPLLVIEEKATLLKQAAEQGWYLYFEHDPFVDAATVVSQGSDYRLGELVQFK